MNVETGEIFRGQAAAEAILRGEPVVPVSEQVARFMEIGKSADGVTLDDLRARIEALEDKGAIDRRMKALGLVMPGG